VGNFLDSSRAISRQILKICKNIVFLQIVDIEPSQLRGDLGARLELFAAQSPRHRKAAEELLSALECLS
jgi:hypothetical protein